MSLFLETAYPGSHPSIAILRPFLQLTLSATIMAVLPLKSAIPICDRRETEGGILEKRMAEKKPLWVRWTTKLPLGSSHKQLPKVGFGSRRHSLLSVRPQLPYVPMLPAGDGIAHSLLPSMSRSWPDNGSGIGARSRTATLPTVVDDSLARAFQLEPVGKEIEKDPCRLPTSAKSSGPQPFYLSRRGIQLPPPA